MQWVHKPIESKRDIDSLMILWQHYTAKAATNEWKARTGEFVTFHSFIFLPLPKINIFTNVTEPKLADSLLASTISISYNKNCFQNIVSIGLIG